MGQRKQDPCKNRVRDGEELLHFSPEVGKDCRIQGSLHYLEQMQTDAEGHGHD